MQQVVYKCDQCNKEIGPNYHISLRLAPQSGIAVPPDLIAKEVGLAGKSGYWHIHKDLNGKFAHFCNPVCLSRFFTRLHKEAVSQNTEYTGADRKYKEFKLKVEPVKTRVWKK